MPDLVEGAAELDVLAHIDYPVRSWPQDGPPFWADAFEDEFRAALRALAGAGRALEINTRCPLGPMVVRWWREEGRAGDVRQRRPLAGGSRSSLPDAAAMAQAHGFRATRHPEARG